MIASTTTEGAPWHIIAGDDANHRRFAILDTLRGSFSRHLKHPVREGVSGRAAAPRRVTDGDVLSAVDLGQSLGEKDYAREFHKLQARLFDAQAAAREAKISTLVAVEGWDAAGKGGAIRRLAYALSAHNYKVVPIAAPTDEERAHHYLWRFWRSLGRAGRITIFDRSWHGRVLVERVDGLIPKSAWQRAYSEINAFEEELTSSGIVLVKFWLHISRAEQLKRFKEREKDAAKRWKLTGDDWCNRKNWNAYASAVNDVIERTSTAASPWQVVPANNKRFARIAIMNAVASALEAALAKRVRLAT